MKTLLVLAYTGWAIYSGYSILTGHSEWLDRRAPLNIAVKAVLSIAVGYVIAMFYLLYLLFRFLGLMSKM